MKRTIEIDDTLQETIEEAKDELRADFASYLKENPDTEDMDTYWQAQGADMMHEIADSNTPIYYGEIDGLYYLYSDELEEAYENEGVGNGSEDNHRQVTIYCYIGQALSNYYNE